MQNVSNILTYFKSELSSLTNNREVASWAYLSIKYILGLNRSDCIIRSAERLSDLDKRKFIQIVEELKKKKPIQYILGETEFCGLIFKLNEHVLIPRPETEGLVSWISEHSFQTALDIGTGSGCIAIVLARNKNVEVTVIDSSNEALKVARENARLNSVEIDFLHQDILTTISLPKVDVIVSNPPYVLEKEKRLMNDNVLFFEPHIALFVPDNNPLLYYKKISYLATKSLNSNGILFFEINEKYAKEISCLLADLGFVNIELKKDINEKDRMIKAVWK